MKPRLGVDVDLVVTQSDKAWDKWLIKQSNLKESLVPLTNIDYNISTYYKNYIDIDPMEFWRNNKLYDNIELVKGSKESLTLLSDKYDLIFISTVKGDHHKSKYYFIKDNFPYLTGFVATKEKYLVNVDVMIDDRVDNLLPFDNSRTRAILFDTPYKQHCPAPDSVSRMDWAQIVNKLL